MYRGNKMKKCFSVLCLFFFIFSILPAAVFAKDDESAAEKVLDLSKYRTTTYYYNGTIITVDAKNGEDSKGNPVYAKAVIVGDGYVRAVAYTDADAALLEKSANQYNSRRVDLTGKTMIPAFVDPHGHIDMTAHYYEVSPAYDVTSLEKLVERGKKDFNEWVNDHTYDDAYGTIEPGGKFWFVTNGYDNTAFKTDNFDKQAYAMPTKDILDKISTEYPILYIHASNHLGAVNSLGLKILSEKMETLKKASPEQYAYFNPEQNWDKDANGEYTGILREGGFYALYMGEAVLTDNTRTRTADSAGVMANAMKVYASYGITTAVAGGGANQEKVMANVPKEERIIDVQDMPGYASKAAFNGATSATSAYNENGLRHGGFKIFLDGSPQGKTAWFAVDKTDPSGGGYYKDANEVLLDGKEHAWWYGEAEGKKMDDATLTTQFADAIQSGLQFTCHANGTGAIQQFIDCYRNALQQCGVDINNTKEVAAVQDRIRPVIIHAQTITNKQLQECKALGINLSFFVDHVYYYGDYHLVSTLGPSRGQLVSPMADAMADGMNLNVTIHQDSPVSTPNMIFSIFNAANRITRDGQPIGRGSANGSSDNDKRITDWQNKRYDTKDERISAYQALKCVTINGAWQNFEENKKGSITVGKQADFVILNVNILSNEFLGLTPSEAKTGRFIEKTINNGKVIYQK